MEILKLLNQSANIPSGVSVTSFDFFAIYLFIFPSHFFNFSVLH